MNTLEPSSWPIVKLTEEKEAFVQQVIKESIEEITKINRKNNLSLKDVLEKTIYKERIRTREVPWKVDPKNEEKKWSKLKSKLAESIALENSDKRDKREQELLREIIDDYTREIAGKFSMRTYRFSVAVVPFLFARLLNSAASGWFRGLFVSKHKVEDRVALKGSVKHLQKLAEKGTIVLVPTHFSNLDSILIGYGIYLAGLPPFLYGAGLNLYNNRIVGYFINRLGAYKVDRRKKNTLYLETLKAFSRIAIERGAHSLFFPGGTRSRSGALEDKLKLGLLSSAVEAQTKNYLNPKNQKKIFVVPLVIGYHFVLEAPSLVRQFLKSTGKEKVYLERDQFDSFFKVFKFVWNFFSRGSKIILSFGKPMDVLGNFVDEEGRSFTKEGKEIDVSKYFVTDGELKPFKQRDAQYTQLLADKIVESYKAENIVLSSHIVSFVAFQMIKKQFKDFDLYNMLKLHEDDTAIEYLMFYKKMKSFQEKLLEYEDNDKLKLDSVCKGNIEELIKEGIKNVGLYHSKKVLFMDKEGRINTKDMNLLYFYHNRLTGYELEQHI